MPNRRFDSSLPSLRRPDRHANICSCHVLGPIPRITELDLHWLAGLLEGEGTFMTGPPSAPRAPVIQFWMTDRDVVERAGAMLDSAVTVVRARREHWKTAYACASAGRALSCG